MIYTFSSNEMNEFWHYHKGIRHILLMYQPKLC
jgi:hypothetical protein